ncbi:MAG: BON domain-containing protein [Candidatus Omnitrophica bacterium]|nr:BON domain-containing protein [Candidatus Omnitrophota bacterium]
MSCRAGTFIIIVIIAAVLGSTKVGNAGIFFASASERDNRIELPAKKSKAFKIDLKDDLIAIRSRDGVVTLTGTVANESHKVLAQKTVEKLRGVKSVDNQLRLEGERTEKNSDGTLSVKW